MKKLIALAAVAVSLLCAGQSYAQVGIHAGYSPEKWVNEKRTMNLNSYFVGLDFMIPVAGDLNASVGAQFRYSAERGQSSWWVIDTKHSTNLMGVEVPIMINYNFRITKDFKVSPFVGPKFTYYIKGRTQSEGSINMLGLNTSSYVEWFEEEGSTLKMNRFGISADFGLAITFQHFHIYGGYNLGLMDMDNDDKTNTKISGPFFGLALGF